MRIDKFLSNMGLGSRKDVHKIVQAGRVCINGYSVSSPDCKFDENSDKVTVDGQVIGYEPFVYIMLNKPKGYISATEDHRGGPVATELIGEDFNYYDLKPAGRLDKDAEGFLLLTNDGDYIHKVISPSSEVYKVYYCLLENEITDEDIEAFRRGLVFKDGTRLRPAELRKGEEDRSAYVKICEGKFHQVKNMFIIRNNRVLYLKRMSIGGVPLDETLVTGGYRQMTEEEKEKIVK